MADRYIIGGESFGSHEQIRKRVREIIERYPFGAPFVGDDFRFMRALLDRHPNAETKIGSGVKLILTRQHPEFRAQAVPYLQRTDGSWTDWSWTQCVSGHKNGSDQTYALRNQVVSQVLAVKNAYFARHARRDGRAPCELTGAFLLPEEVHVDHIPPQTFKRLVAGFLAEHDIELEDIRITPSADNQIKPEMTSLRQIVAWEEYHRRNARLRIVSPFANQSISRIEAEQVSFKW